MGKRLATVNIMTATLAPGDAIGNYIATKTRLLREMGIRVRLYADFVDPAYPERVQHSRWYLSTGKSILWYHYSIYSPNVEIARASADFKVMDYHGVSPPELFAGWNDDLANICRIGLERLPVLAEAFERYVVHSEYTRGALVDAGFAAERICKLPLCVDLNRLKPLTHGELVEHLEKMRYLIFVGRIVPQKDIKRLIEIFARVQGERPEVKLLLVGSREQLPTYQAELDELVAEYRLEGCVLFTGKVAEPAVLATLIAHAEQLVVVSEWESFCVPLVEGMAFGVPPVVHDLPPLPEVGGGAAVVVDKHEVGAAAGEIIALLDDGERRERLGAAALGRSEQFTAEVLGERLRAYMGELREVGGFDWFGGG